MSQQIEIELKNLVTKEEFIRIKEYFHLNDHSPRKQVNYYFDTNSFYLKEHGSALRIRFKDGKYKLTLKEPAKVGLLETSQILTEKEAKDMINDRKIVDGVVIDRLKGMNAPVEQLTYFGSLTTERIEFDYKGGLLVLDYSYYLNKEDFEIEYEVTELHEGTDVFQQLLTELHIPVRKTKNKIERLYEAKYERK